MTADLRHAAGAPPAPVAGDLPRSAAEPAHRSGLGTMPALTGLRGVAALAVLTYHSWSGQLTGGFIGVDVFFVLSGFLITALLLHERVLTGRISLARFYGRRALRLLPALVLLLGVCAAVLRFAPDLPYAAATSEGVRGTVEYIANWQFAAHADQQGLLSHTWSLSLEEQFYLLWPPLLLALVVWGGRTVAFIACLVGIGAAAEVRLLLELHGIPWYRLYAGLDTRADALLVGCALALAVDLGYLRRVSPRALAGVGTVGIAGLAWAALRLSGPAAVSWWVYTPVAICAAALIALVVLRPTHRLARALSSRPLVTTGRVSYGLYLWHYPIVVALLNSSLAASWPRPLLFGAVLGLTWAAAATSWVLVESPCLRLKSGLRAAERGSSTARGRDPIMLPGVHGHVPAAGAVPLQ